MQILAFLKLQFCPLACDSSACDSWLLYYHYVIFKKMFFAFHVTFDHVFVVLN